MAIEFLDTRGLKIEGTAVRLRNNFLRIVSLVTKFVVTFRSIQPKFISLLKINRLYVIGIEPAK